MTYNDLFVRPTYKKFGLYMRTGDNRAKVIFEGTKEECYSKREAIFRALTDKNEDILKLRECVWIWQNNVRETQKSVKSFKSSILPILEKAALEKAESSQTSENFSKKASLLKDIFDKFVNANKLITNSEKELRDILSLTNMVIDLKEKEIVNEEVSSDF